MMPGEAAAASGGCGQWAQALEPPNPPSWRLEVAGPASSWYGQSGQSFHYLHEWVIVLWD